MRLIRANGQNISPSDDAKLYNKFFSNGLFNSVSITLPTESVNTVHIGYLYGIVCGRDFTVEEDDFKVKLPTTATDTGGHICVRINLVDDQPLSVVSYLNSEYDGHPIQEDINDNGQVYEMEIAKYNANAATIIDVTATYTMAQYVFNKDSEILVEKSKWSSTKDATIGESSYYTNKISLKNVYDNHPYVLFLPITGDVPTRDEYYMYGKVDYIYISDNVLTLCMKSKPNVSRFVDFKILVKGVEL